MDQTNQTGQPAPDPTPRRMLALSTGLVIGTSLIFGALLGGVLGHFLLDNAFGLEHDVWVGAVVGAIVLVALGLGLVRFLATRVPDTPR